jgi:ATP-dependent Clp protease protease subunit
VTPGDDPFDRLLERRTVFLRGPLDDAAANRLAAELMTLDATGDGEITLLVNSDGGPVDSLFPVSDTLALVRGPVATTCLGQAAGTAAVVVALGTATRRVAARARLTLRVPQAPGGSGTAGDLQREAAMAADRRRQLARLVAGATGHALDVAAGDLDHGPWLTPEEAIAAGLVDEVVGTGPPARP